MKVVIHHRLMLTVSLSAAVFFQPALAVDFDEIAIFGDSLSDSGAYVGNADAGGGGRFTTNPGPVWVENLGSRYGLSVTANNPNNPANTSASGNNFAQGGAQVVNPIGIGQSASPQAALPIQTQVTNYLALSPTASANGLFTVWGGANDLFFNATLVGGGTPVDTAVNNMLASAGLLVTEIDRLAAAGAGTIIVPNIPDIGQTPSVILQAISSVGATIGAPAATISAAQGAATIALLTPANSSADQTAVKNAAMAAAEAALGVPAGTLNQPVADTGALFTGLTTAFNTGLTRSLNASSANVIRLDVQSFLTEVIADPVSFGLSNVTGTACLVPSSLSCTSAFFASADAASSFLFADGVHPTTVAHSLIASYAASLLEAPNLISSLPEAALGNGRSIRNNLRAQMRLMADQPAGTFVPYISGDYHTQEADATAEAEGYEVDAATFVASAAYRVTNHITAGAAFSYQSGEVEWNANRGGYDLDGLYGSVFAGFDNDRFFANTIMSFGEVDYDAIQRNITFGSATQSEVGDTSGTHLLISLTAGAHLFHFGGVNLGPILGATYQDAQVESYQENGNNATSMRYDGQKRQSLVIEGGVFASMNASDNLRVRGSIVREEELKDGDRTVRSGLKSSNSLTSTTGQRIEEGAWVVEAGASMAVSSSVSATANYAYRHGDDYESDHQIQVGVQISLD